MSNTPPAVLVFTMFVWFEEDIPEIIVWLLLLLLLLTFKDSVLIQITPLFRVLDI